MQCCNNYAFEKTPLLNGAFKKKNEFAVLFFFFFAWRVQTIITLILDRLGPSCRLSCTVDLRCRLGYVVILNLDGGCFPKCIDFNTKPRRSELRENMKKSETDMHKDTYSIARKLSNCVAIDVVGLLVAR